MEIVPTLHAAISACVFPAPLLILRFTPESRGELTSPKPYKNYRAQIGAVCEQWCLCLDPYISNCYCEPPTGSFGLLSLCACKEKIQHNFQLPKQWSGWGDMPNLGVFALFARGGGGVAWGRPYL